MLGPYRAILARPGALRFSAAGLLARMEVAMIALGTVLLVQSTTGSYAVGGAVSATYGVASAVAAPVLGGLVDRRGQSRVLRVAVPVHSAFLVLLVVLTAVRAPLPLVFAAAAAAGLVQVSIGSLVRARWAGLLAGSPRLPVAFALESVLDEVVFIVGPVVVTLLAAVVSPALGPLIAAATALAGGLLLAAQRGTEPVSGAAARGTGEHRGSVLREPGLVVLVLVFLGVGGVFGSAEVTVSAVTKEAGVPALAGGVLSLWAVGSMVAGLVYGAIAWRSRLHVRVAVLTVLLALSIVPMSLAPVPLLPVAFLLAGVVIAPVITSATTLTEALVPAGRLTEGLAWTGTALGLTYALSAAAAGAAIDGGGAHAGFLVPLAAGAVAAAVVLAGLPLLRPTRLRRDGAPSG